MKVVTLLFFALALIPSYMAQSLTTPSVGQSRAEVLRSMGEPKLVYSGKLSKYYPAVRRNALLSTVGRVSDVYTKHFGGIEFEMLVVYGFDTSRSRLHPTEAVESILFTPDSHSSYIEIAKRVPSVNRLCSHGCKVLGLYFLGSPSLYIYPKSASEEVAESESNDLEAVAHPAKNVPCIEINFTIDSLGGNGDKAPDFEKFTVDTLRVEEFDIGIEKALAAGHFIETDWKP